MIQILFFLMKNNADLGIMHQDKKLNLGFEIPDISTNFVFLEKRNENYYYS